MDGKFVLSRFISDSNHRADSLKPEQLETLISALCSSERPRSFRALFWLMLKTLQSHGALHAAVLEAWIPSEADLAQLLEDAGGSGTKAVLELEGARGQLGRLWQLCDDASLPERMKSTDPWNVASLAPMAALVAEQQLDALIDAVVRGREWSDPNEVLSPSGDGDFDLEALIGLAQGRMVSEGGGGEALHVVTLRLLSYADRLELPIN